jgi:CheY-like chemotaxis protein
MTAKRILFVEDDYITIQPIVEYLENLGYTVDVAEDALEAIERFASQSYSHLFLDIMLAPAGVFELEETADGRYTGLRLLEYARTHKAASAVKRAKIALITNWREQPQVDNTAAKYHAKVMRKPLSIADMEEFLA